MKTKVTLLFFILLSVITFTEADEINFNIHQRYSVEFKNVSDNNSLPFLNLHCQEKYSNTHCISDINQNDNQIIADAEDFPDANSLALSNTAVSSYSYTLSSYSSDVPGISKPDNCISKKYILYNVFRI
ncbi:MAG TPA: hypothetical protein PLS10_04340 [Chitinophagales bacterium]|nr:hypothetical protein [Chitinophagales bacterium]